MANKDNLFLTPVGRIIGGSLYEPQTTDALGKPLVNEDGTPKVNHYFALGIAKGAETHWNQTEWGAFIWAYVNAQFANNVPNGFIWRIDDGDSTEVSDKGFRLCDREYNRRHWILRIGSKYAPSIYHAHEDKYIVDPNVVYTGSYAQVRIEMYVRTKNPNPCLMFHHKVVIFNSYGIRINTFEVEDPKTLGFSKTVVPGGSLTPPPTTSAATAIPAQATAAPVQPAYQQPAAAPSVAVQPHNGILMPTAPAAAPAAPRRIMTAKAGGFTYEQFKATDPNWTDELLISQGYMLA